MMPVSSYGHRPSRHVARTEYRCDICTEIIAKGKCVSKLGMFESCKGCEPGLILRYEGWKDRMRERRMLSVNQVIRIREVANTGLTYPEVAAQFGIRKETVGEIVRGESYKDAIRIV